MAHIATTVESLAYLISLRQLSFAKISIEANHSTTIISTYIVFLR